MKIVKYILLFTFSLLILGFMLSNREIIYISLFPTDITIRLPIFMLIIVSAIFGVILSGFLNLFTSGKYRLNLRSSNKKVQKLEKELEKLKLENN